MRINPLSPQKLPPNLLSIAHTSYPAHPLFSSALYWSGAESYFFFLFLGGRYEAFLGALNGTMASAYRGQSCFIEPVLKSGEWNKLTDSR